MKKKSLKNINNDIDISEFMYAIQKIKNSLIIGGFGHAIWCNYQHETCLKCNCGISDLITLFDKYNT